MFKTLYFLFQPVVGKSPLDASPLKTFLSQDGTELSESVSLMALFPSLLRPCIPFTFISPVYTCNYCCYFRCDFCLLIDVNEWMSYGCSDEGIHIPQTFVTHLLVLIHQKKKIAAKIASVNEPIYRQPIECPSAFVISLRTGVYSDQAHLNERLFAG